MPNGSERYAPWPARLRGEGRARKTTARLCELSTDVREAPMAGGTLFAAHAVLNAPPTSNIEELRSVLGFDLGMV